LLGFLSWVWTLCLSVLLLAAILAWQLGGLPAETLARMRPTAWGACALLWRRDGVELATLLHGSKRFLNRDYGVFDCCRMAFTEASLILGFLAVRAPFLVHVRRLCCI
jgi:hypothetical protein